MTLKISLIIYQQKREKSLFKEYLACNKEDENLLREKLDEKHVFNMFNRWARQNNIEPINISNYKDL